MPRKKGGNPRGNKDAAVAEHYCSTSVFWLQTSWDTEGEDRKVPLSMSFGNSTFMHPDDVKSGSASSAKRTESRAAFSTRPSTTYLYVERRQSCQKDHQYFAHLGEKCRRSVEEKRWRDIGASAGCGDPQVLAYRRSPARTAPCQKRK